MVMIAKGAHLARTRPPAIEAPIIAEVKLIVAPDFERIVCDVEESVACLSGSPRT
jgi:hypothetical protein